MRRAHVGMLRKTLGFAWGYVCAMPGHALFFLRDWIDWVLQELREFRSSIFQL